MINLQGVSKAFGDKPVLRRVDLVVGPGELVVLLGPSGCGKTTLLRLIAGLTEPDNGIVEVGGRTVATPSGAHVAPCERGIGMVFQDLALWPHLDALEHVRFGLRRHAGGMAAARRRALETLSAMRIAELAHRRPHQLSGGQRQRLALARALAPRPPVLLLDEPFSNLDPLSRDAVSELLREVQDQANIAILYVTHVLDEVLRLAQRILLIDGGCIQSSLAGQDLAAMSLDELDRWYRASLAG